MTAADKRIEDLLARWHASLDLHARYVQLDDAAYALAERWPSHQRPTAWVIELTRKRLRELRDQLVRRQAAGDAAFAEALELMSFLTGLLDSEHIERFIPLATGQPVDTAASATVQQPRLRAAKPRASTAHTGTHRQAATPKPVATHKPAPAQRVAATATPKAAASTPATRARRDPPPTQPMPAAPAAADAGTPSPDARTRQVIADAVRMLEWGREWPALAGLIARMADRPGENDVWKILRAHRGEIFTRAGRPSA
jgi:hypothetical protein